MGSVAALLRCRHCAGKLFRDAEDTPLCYVCLNCGRRRYVPLPPVTRIIPRLDLVEMDWTARAIERGHQTEDTARLVWSAKAHLFQAQVWDQTTMRWHTERLVPPREIGRALQGYSGAGFHLAFQDADGLVQPVTLGET
jgi:hypothetical protein